MSITLQTALISAGVALIIALLSAFFTLRLERRRWLVDLLKSYETERYKIRLVEYPRAFAIIADLSYGAEREPTPEIALQVAYKLNTWFYGAGGVCAEADTRGAILELRGCCFQWANKKEMPEHLYDWRNAAMLLLRRDLGLDGLESTPTDKEKIKPLLKKVKADIARAK